MMNFLLLKPVVPRLPVPTDWYDFTVNAKVPVCIAIGYVSLCILVTLWLPPKSAHIGSKKDDTPMPKSQAAQSRLLFWAIIVHNAVLALYSALSFLGFASVVLFVFGTAWTVGGSQGRTARVADLLCNLQEPVVDVAANATVEDWKSMAQVRHVWYNAVSTYGWLFYLSKIYELGDTLVLVWRGKTPGIFQVYHHTGALICVWAGLVNRAAPLWSFIFMNCGIHALMYTYYILVLCKIQIPKAFKVCLTAMQMTQTTVAILYGLVVLVVSYRIAPSKDGIGAAVAPNLTLSHQVVRCAAGAGERTAIMMNVAYLIPLLGLFVHFFHNSYRRPSTLAGKH